MSEANGKGNGALVPAVPVARIAPADRPVGKVEVTMLPTAQDTAVTKHRFEYVAGLQVDDVFVTLGNQDNLPIALFSTRLVQSVVFLDHDKEHSDIVIPTMKGIPSRIIQ